MGERKGQNKYYPPDFDPKKHKSLNAYHGTHALRERARKLDEGILIIRFEMPYNIWCEGCKAHIAMGVRYNAQKKKVGMYFSTPIHEFRMKCHLCEQHFVIRTDPANMDYVIMEGARRKEQRWDMAENEQIVTDERSDIKRLSADPMFKLEHDTTDKSKLTKLIPTLKELQDSRSDWKDDYRLNSMMRSTFRGEKKAINEQKTKDQEFIDKWNLDIKLVPENEIDVKAASLYKYNSLASTSTDVNDVIDDNNRAEKRKQIEQESIFDEASTSLAKKNHSSSSSSSSAIISKMTLKPQSAKELQINGLRKKLTKSIQEKKLAETADLKKSLLFSSSTSDTKATPKLTGLIKINDNKAQQKHPIDETNADKPNSSLSIVNYDSDESDSD